MVEKKLTKFKKNFPVGPKAVLVVTLVFMIASVGITSMRKTIKVSIDGKEIRQISTFKKTYGQALKDNNISVSSNDKVVPCLNQTIKDKSELTIKKAVKVSVQVDGKKLAIKSAEDNVGDMLKKSGIKLKNEDKISPKQNEKIKKGLNVVVTRVESKLLKDTETIDYETVTKKDEDLVSGRKRTIQEGQNGQKEITVKVVYENGKEVNRKVVSQKVKRQPVSRIVAMGTKQSQTRFPQSRGSSVGPTSGKSIRMRATAYSSGYQHTGKNPGNDSYGLTATGTRVRRNPNGYSSVAVDPRVIPLGTKLYVEGYGYAIAEDTGSAVKGNVIDLYFDSDGEVDNWGSRWINVYILK